MILQDKLKYLALFTLSLFMISCSDEDTEVQPLSTSTIEGSWSLAEINTTPPVDLEDDGNTDANVMNQTDCFNGMSLDFDTNGNLDMVTSAINFDSSASPSFDCSTQTSSGSYTINQKDLTVTTQISGNEETETLNVDVQNNTLSFTLTESDIADFFSIPGGESFSPITEAEFIYEKD